MKQIINISWKVIEIVCKYIVIFLCKLLRKEYSEEILNSFLQFIKFGIVGISNTVISYFLYVISLNSLNSILTQFKYNYLIAQIIAFVLSVLWSFYWNNKMVFVLKEGQNRSILKALIKTYISYSFTGLFLNSILLFIWVDIFGISEFVAPIINLLVSVPINFIINKMWAFKSDN